LTLFAEHGYDGASMRSIAAAAGVDPALIRHFFGDKATLFAHTVAARTTIPARMAEALVGDEDTLGYRLTDGYLRTWQDPDTRPILMALVRSATTSEHAAQMLHETLLASLLDSQKDLVADTARLQRLALAASHLFGLAFARHIIKLAPMVAFEHDELVAAVAPTIQHYLTAQ